MQVTQIVQMSLEPRNIFSDVYALVVQNHCDQVVRGMRLICSKISGLIYKNTRKFFSHKFTVPVA